MQAPAHHRCSRSSLPRLKPAVSCRARRAAYCSVLRWKGSGVQLLSLIIIIFFSPLACAEGPHHQSSVPLVVHEMAWSRPSSVIPKQEMIRAVHTETGEADRKPPVLQVYIVRSKSWKRGPPRTRQQRRQKAACEPCTSRGHLDSGPLPFFRTTVLQALPLSPILLYLMYLLCESSTYMPPGGPSSRGRSESADHPP